MNKYKSIDLGGYEGHFKCPNCGNAIGIKQGNTGGEETLFKCLRFPTGEEWGGCGKEWQVFAKEN